MDWDLDLDWDWNSDFDWNLNWDWNFAWNWNLDQFSRDCWVSGALFSDMFVSWSHFFVIFWCLGTSWDIFGSLEGPGVPNPGCS